MIMNQPQLIRVTDAAADRIKALILQSDKPVIGLRVSVNSKGCSGMSYVFEYAGEKKKLDDLASKFLELKKLAIKYKEGKDKEIGLLNDELDKFKKTVDESNNLYESMLDKTTKSLEKILLNTESISKIQ